MAGRYHWPRGGQPATDQVTARWSLDFIWTPMFILIQLTTCILNSDLRKILPATHFPELKNCVGPEVSVAP